MATPGTQITGEALTVFMARLSEYLGFFEKVGKRLRNDDVTLAFVKLFAHEARSRREGRLPLGGEVVCDAGRA